VCLTAIFGTNTSITVHLVRRPVSTGKRGLEIGASITSVVQKLQIARLPSFSHALPESPKVAKLGRGAIPNRI